mmetsp:Transcript_8612/g.21195  ORF Transcript_8612/g.21195 Transcript_8612/m.21195 type:complete len:90 (-) Transcript_8612:230-499(-)
MTAWTQSPALHHHLHQAQPETDQPPGPEPHRDSPDPEALCAPAIVQEKVHVETGNDRGGRHDAHVIEGGNGGPDRLSECTLDRQPPQNR